MAKEKYMDEFTRDEQERMEAIRKPSDMFVAALNGIPTVMKSWKSDDRIVVHDPNAGRQPSPLDMVPLSVSVLSNTFLPRWKVELIEEQNKQTTKAQRLSDDIESEGFSYKSSATKAVKTQA
ncbi:hypothetical protein [Burkholderia cenocepacia]|uniref:hypothetical protein n=1 Tax=Burkholderia cenocepacia TaxID=95486 RepID=UPI00117755ED|nr:hypothetical protein [Burkholderia cenocepacia]